MHTHAHVKGRGAGAEEGGGVCVCVWVCVCAGVCEFAAPFAAASVLRHGLGHGLGHGLVTARVPRYTAPRHHVTSPRTALCLDGASAVQSPPRRVPWACRRTLGSDSLDTRR